MKYLNIFKNIFIYIYKKVNKLKKHFELYGIWIRIFEKLTHR